MKFIKLIVFLALTLSWFSCAQVVNPTGGPKDVDPPKALKTIPEEPAINFSGKDIIISFDEFITLKDLNSQLIISPLLAEQPEITVKNKELRIHFNDDLKQNTTYTLNFGNSIRDITESNIADNFQYVFSTGSFIDSLSLSGKIENSLSRQPVKDISVMLYKSMNDSAPFISRPDYFTKTNAEGFYTVNHIAPGKYKLFALQDLNSNYKPDGKELIGFSNDQITLSKKDTQNIQVFEALESKQRLKKSYFSCAGEIVLVFNKSVTDLQLTPQNFQPSETFLEFSKNNDTVHYYLPGLEKEEVAIQITENKMILDTIELKQPSKNASQRGKSGSNTTFKVNANFEDGALLELNESIQLTFGSPLRKYDFSRITLKKDKENIPIKAFFQDSLHRKLIISGNFIEASKYSLVIEPAAFTDIFGIKNDTLKFEFKTREQKFYGSVKANINVNNGSYIIQLLDEKENVISENKTSSSTILNYEHLKPALYKLKVIVDDNGNGKWDTGDYFKKIQPEKVFYYPNPLNIRSNWDLEIDWKVEKL